MGKNVFITMDAVIKKKILEKVKNQMINVKGIVGVAELNKEQCVTVASLEERSMENVLSGMGRGKNEGVKEALSREVTIVIFTDNHFDLPKDVNVMELVSEGEVVGRGLKDLERISQFKKDKNYVVVSDFFVIKRGAKINPATFASGETYFVFHGIQTEQFSKIPEMKDHVISFPSPPVFAFLKEQFKDEMNLDDPQLGGFLIGFNLSQGLS